MHLYVYCIIYNSQIMEAAQVSVDRWMDKDVWGAGVAQWVKASAFSLGHDPRVMGSSLVLGFLLSGEPASFSLSAYFLLSLPNK